MTGYLVHNGEEDGKILNSHSKKLQKNKKNVNFLLNHLKEKRIFL